MLQLTCLFSAPDIRSEMGWAHQTSCRSATISVSTQPAQMQAMQFTHLPARPSTLGAPGRLCIQPMSRPPKPYAVSEVGVFCGTAQAGMQALAVIKQPPPGQAPPCARPWLRGLQARPGSECPRHALQGSSGAW